MTKTTKREMTTVLVDFFKATADQYSSIGMVGENEITHEDAIAYLEHELELLNKKSASRGSSKTAKENAPLMDKIVEVLSVADGGKTVSEIQQMDETLNGLSNQKVSALMRSLVSAGKVNKTTEKGKSLFALA